MAVEQERQRKDQKRIEADRLADLEQLRVDQLQQRMYQDRMEAERLPELDRRVERELVEAETEELERQKVLERLVAAMARGQEAEYSRQEGETALWDQRTQETLKAIRDVAVQVEATRIARGFGVRLAEQDGTLAGKVRRTSWTRPRTVWTSVRRYSSLRLPRGEPGRARSSLRERVEESGAARRSVEWWPASLCFVPMDVSM